MKLKKYPTLVTLLLSSEAISIIPGSEFGVFHFYLVLIALLHILNNRIFSKQLIFLIISSMTLLYSITVFQLATTVVMRSISIMILMLCSLSFVNSQRHNFSLENVYLGFKYYVILAIIAAPISLVGPLQKFWFLGRYQFLNSEPFNLATVLIIFLILQCSRNDGFLKLNVLNILIFLILVTTKSLIGFLGIFFIILLFTRGIFFKLIFIVIICIATFNTERLDSVLTVIINLWGNIEIVVLNPSIFASLSTLFVAFEYLSDHIFGAGPGNFVIAYENYMKQTILYEISLLEKNYLFGLNMKGGSGVLQRFLVEFGYLAPIVALFYFKRKTQLFKIKYLIITLIIVGRNENIFKPDILLYLYYFNSIVNEKDLKFIKNKLSQTPSKTFKS